MSEAKTYIAGLIQNARAAQKEFEEKRRQLLGL